MFVDESAMAQNPKNTVVHPQFKWFGLAIMIASLEGALFFINHLFSPICLSLLLPVYLLLMLGLLRYVDWKNGLLAALLFCTLHPVRFIFHWWVNPIVYGLVAFLCLLLIIRFVRQYAWKNSVAVVMVVCMALAVVQTIVSAAEIGECYIDDRRYTLYFYCEPTHGRYQQIESLPIGMQGYCYYCPWY